MFRPFDLDLSLTDGVALGLLVPLCIFLAYQVYRSGAPAWRFTRWLLAVRILAFALLLALLMEPILAVRVKTRRRPLVAVLVDNSESMRVVDGGRSRRDVVRDILSDGAFRDLAQDARIARYRFADVLQAISDTGVDSLLWDGRATDIAGGLDALRERTAGEGLVAAILMTDGGHNLGGHPGRAATDLGAPVYVVGVGRAAAPTDVALVSAVIDPLGYVDHPLSLSVVLRTSGLEGVQELLTVSEGDAQVAVQAVVLSEGEQQVTFKLHPERPGRHVYRIHVAPQSGELSTQNNAVIVSAEVLESRVRVLIVGRSPSPDLAYLYRTLKADANLEVERVIATLSGAWTYALQAQLSRSESWNLVVLVGLPRVALSGVPEQRLAAFVRDGGGLLVVGGAEAFGESYRQSPLADVAPLAFFRRGETYRPEPFQLEIPGGAERHPIMRISDDPLADRARWEALPPLLGYNLNSGARAGATVLAVHPVERAGGDKMPLIATARVGRGKSMAVAVRSFWRFGLMMWGIGKTDAVSRTFWTNAVRWLVVREDISRVRAVVDKPVYRSGEPVTFHAQVLNDLLQPQEGAVVTVAIADSTGERQAALRDEGGGHYSGKVGGFAQGDYPFQVHAAKDKLDLGSGNGRFTVGHYSLEYEDIRMDAELLQMLAARSGGVFITPDALPAAIRGLSFAPQPVTLFYRFRLWGHIWPAFVLILLLGVEWAVRRRRGMV